MRRSDGVTVLDVRCGVFVRRTTLLALCVLSVFSGSGCLKLGYDALARPSDAAIDAAPERADARAPVDADLQDSAESPASDAGSLRPDMEAGVDAGAIQSGLDAGADAAVDASAADAGMNSDPDGSAADGGTTLQPDAEVDSGPPCAGAVVNACGGCSALTDLPAQNCGQCGLGRFVCTGTDAVACEGGDAQPVATGGTVMIDDLEDGDSLTLSGDGYWFAYSDLTEGTIDPPNGSRITPVSQGAAGTTRSAHISGGGFTDYGAGLILWPNATECEFDSAAQRGVGFWIKGSSTVLLSVATTRTRDPAYCGTTCNDFHARSFALTTNWTYYQVRWSTLQQAGWGTPATFIASQVLYFQFSFGANVNFDLYVDEFRFY